MSIDGDVSVAEVVAVLGVGEVVLRERKEEGGKR